LRHNADIAAEPSDAFGVKPASNYFRECVFSEAKCREPAVLERVARSNAAHWGTHIRRRNRKRSDDAVAVLPSLAAALRALAT
jgi:hypothetical protein